MIKFFKNDVFTCSGSPIAYNYSPVIGSDGKIEIEVSGQYNLDEQIQSFLESTDIESIISRFVNGDFSALSAKKPLYGDFTEMPKTYAEFLQLQIDSRNLFDSLPVSIKSQFGNDPNEFFVKSGTKEWFDIIQPIFESKSDDISVKKEVVSDES